MEKLELKHIVGYLPYRLKVKTGNGKLIRTLNIEIDENFRDIISLNNLITGIGHKPILRPLSDLTKEIEVNGEKFVPCEKLISLLSYSEDYKKKIFWEHKTLTKNTEFISFKSSVCKEFTVWISNISANEYSIVQKLYEWHFDLHSLIEKGLAIDLNTLNNGIQ